MVYITVLVVLKLRDITVTSSSPSRVCVASHYFNTNQSGKNISFTKHHYSLTLSPPARKEESREEEEALRGGGMVGFMARYFI